MARPRGKAFWLALARKGRLRRSILPTSAGITELDSAMMMRALELADIAANKGEAPIGAVVYSSPTAPDAGRILGEGYNEREVLRDPSAHAEFTAILAAAAQRGDWRLSDCTLAVTLEPCPMCAGLIVNSRIGRVIYGAADPKAGAVHTLYRMLSDPRLNHRPTVIPGVCAEECSARLTKFFRELREKHRKDAERA